MPRPRGLVQRLDQWLHRHGPLPRRARLLVAVSGGADSVALLRLLAEINRSAYWGWKLVVGHVDHGLRGRASREDARFVQALAKQLKLPYVEARLNLAKKGKNACSEDTARQARLKALQEMVHKKKCLGVVTAHHADDQAETVLMRMFRGCGLEGLAGMADSTMLDGMQVYRPLLTLRRKALREYLTDIGQPWREDQSNASETYLRNRVRLNLMPLLEVLWPRAVEALGRLAVLARETQYMVEMDAGNLLEEYVGAPPGLQVEIPRTLFPDAPMPLASEMLRQLIQKVGGSPETADFERIREAVRLLQGPSGGKRIEMGAGVTVVLQGQGTGIVEILGPKKRAAAGPKGKMSRRRGGGGKA